jgi:hypothetical protein
MSNFERDSASLNYQKHFARVRESELPLTPIQKRSKRDLELVNLA